MINPEIASLVLRQNEQRGVWTANDNPLQLDRMLMIEYGELKEAYQEAMIGQSAFALASELGDVFYLHEKRKTLGNVPDYITAHMNHAYMIAETAGIDPNDAVFIKVLRNAQKYPVELEYLYNEYHGYVSACKRQWSAQGGDSAFSEAIIDIL